MQTRESALLTSLRAGTMSPAQVYEILEAGLAAGHMAPAEFRRLEAVVEGFEAAQ